MTPCRYTTWRVAENGYGRKGELYAHREAYIEHFGPIPPGHTVDHTCHNTDPTCAGGKTCRHRACIEPSHLEAVTRGENVLRGKSLQANNARRTACPCGRAYDQITTSGRRRCSVCHAERCRSQRR